MKTKIDSIYGYTDADFRDFYNNMSPARQKKADAYRSENNRKLCILGDKIARECISEFSGADPRSIEFYLDKNGKPQISGSSFFFNISHSGAYAVCVVSESRVGADIEKISEKALRAVKKFASVKEAEFIGSSEYKACLIWTLKEAYLKAKGTGIAGGLQSVEFEVKDNETLCSDMNFECYSETIGSDYTVSFIKEKNN